jgi:hypothetical protein
VIVAMKKIFHLDFVAIMGNGELLIWWWDIGIHMSNGLLQMKLMTNRFEEMIGLLNCGDVVRGFVDFF